MDGDVLRLLQAQPRQVPHLLRQGGREQESLPALGQVFHDAVDGSGEAQVEDTIGLVEDQQLQVAGVETVGLVHVLQEPARRAD
eukprot:760819-Hanusia_phi.AAC.7